jgi:hypothetical protein
MRVPPVQRPCATSAAFTAGSRCWLVASVMNPAKDVSAQHEAAVAVSSGTADAEARDVFINPLPAAAAAPNSGAPPQHPPVGWSHAQPDAAAAAAAIPAHPAAQPLLYHDADVTEARALLLQHRTHPEEPAPLSSNSMAHRAAPRSAAQPRADDDADASEVHTLLPQHHADSGQPGSLATNDVEGLAQGDSDSEAVSLDSPAAGRPPDSSAATMANPYWEIHGMLRDTRAAQPPVEPRASKGQQVGRLTCTLGSAPLCVLDWAPLQSTALPKLAAIKQPVLRRAASAGWAWGAPSAGAPDAAGDHPQPTAIPGAPGCAPVARGRWLPARLVLNAPSDSAQECTGQLSAAKDGLGLLCAGFCYRSVGCRLLVPRDYAARSKPFCSRNRWTRNL